LTEIVHGVFRLDDIEQIKELDDSRIFASVFTLLHEDGHARMIRLLRLPHTYVRLNIEAMKRNHRSNHELIAFIKYKPRNLLDEYLVAISGIFYPFFYLLSCRSKIPKDWKRAYLFLLKTALRQAIYNLPHIHEEFHEAR